MGFMRQLFKGLFKGIILLIVVLFAVGIVFSDAAWFRRLSGEKFYEELELRVEAQVLPDGSMNVKETRVLQFNGDFSRYRRQLPHKGFGEMRVVRVSEPTAEYTRVQTASGRPAGKYLFSRSREAGQDVYNVELFFAADNEKRTFVIEYNLLDVIKVHKDTAELYWQFIGRNRSVNIDLMTVNLRIPSGAQAEEVRVWGHGPLRGDVRKQSSNELVWETTRLDKSRFLESRVTFPNRLVPQAQMLTNRVALAGILAEERRWAEERAAEQQQALYLLIASVAFGLMSCFVAWWVYNRYGRKFKGLMEIDYYRELPGNYSPAEAGCLIETGTVRPQAISATFMDLARRGYIRLEPSTTPETTDILVRQLKPVDQALQLHERILLEFFFNQVGHNQPAVWFGALKQYSKDNPEATRDVIDDFRQTVSAAVRVRGFFETKKTGKRIAQGCFFISLVLASLSYVMGVFPPMLASLVSAVAFFISMRKSRELTATGQAQFDLWQAFRRFLKDFSNLDQAQLPQLILWEHYLVYAVALGVAAEVIRQLPIVYPQVNDPANNFGYYWGGMYHTGYGVDGAVSSSFSGLTSFAGVMDSLEDSWSSAASAVAPSSSSSSGGSFGGDGGGGGFSGGGGDGGGGGGGDAD